MLLKPGTTCWQAERTPRASVLIDVEAYFAAVKSAISRARRSVHVLGWAFNPKTDLAPELQCADPDAARLAPFLKAVALERPDLDIRILCWKAALPIAATQQFYPQRAAICKVGCCAQCGPRGCARCCNAINRRRWGHHFVSPFVKHFLRRKINISNGIRCRVDAKCAHFLSPTPSL